MSGFRAQAIERRAETLVVSELAQKQRPSRKTRAQHHQLDARSCIPLVAVSSYSLVSRRQLDPNWDLDSDPDSDWDSDWGWGLNRNLRASV